MSGPGATRPREDGWAVAGTHGDHDVSHPTKKPQSPLIAAAEALEEELRRLASLAREAQRLPLDSQRNLEATQGKLAELGAVDERLRPLVAGLMAAVKQLVEDQQAQTAALTTRSEEVRRRAEVFRELMVRYAGLGKASQELNALVQAFAAGGRAGDETAPAAEPPSLETVQSSMNRLIESAAEVTQAARGEDFEDIARQAESLRQSLLSARNKLDLLAARHDSSGAVQ
jgi:DNA repair exonuclease SbcCD ATPase subunit